MFLIAQPQGEYQRHVDGFAQEPQGGRLAGGNNRQPQWKFAPRVFVMEPSTPIIQWPLHGADNVVWTVEPASDGYVSIVARHSGKALDVEYASTDDGGRVIQYTPNGGANQRWLLCAVESTSAAVTSVSER